MTYRVDRMDLFGPVWSMTTNNREYAWYWARRPGSWIVYRDGIKVWP